MSDIDPALKALGAFPILQAAVGVLIVIASIWLMRRGEADRKEAQPPPAVPQWLMMGPGHDAIGAIHNIAEQSRQQIELLGRIENLMTQQVTETTHAKAALEMIRNESRLR